MARCPSIVGHAPLTNMEYSTASDHVDNPTTKNAANACFFVRFRKSMNIEKMTEAIARIAGIKPQIIVSVFIFSNV